MAPTIIVQVNESGTIRAQLNEHYDAWRYIVWKNAERIGEVMFKKEGKRIKLMDVEIFEEWRGNGIGTLLLKSLIEEWRTNDFTEVVGSVVANRGTTKDQLFAWYRSFGAEIVPKRSREVPGYAGELTLRLRPNGRDNHNG